MLVFALFFLAAPNAPPSAWHFQGQYRTELACNFVGALRQATVAKAGLTVTFKCVPREG